MEGLRILTVRQPWAWAIISGGKDVENRTRNVAGTYRGPVAIHAAKQRLTISDDLAAGALIGDLTGFRPLFTLPAGLGTILGVVDLVEVHNSTNALTQHPTCFGPGERLLDRGIGYCSPWAESGAVHLVLANPRPLAEPIPFKGALGLRRLPDNVAAQVWAGMTA